jgi:uncharacterized protein (DUF2236 family)
MSLEMVFADGKRKFVFHLRPLLVPPSNDGLFSRESVIRRVYSDSAVGYGAGTALLLQLAHPAIARGVHDHSDYENRPLDRLFGTFLAVNAVVFGSRRDAEQMRTAIGGVHARVTGPGYRALDPDLLCWVNATLLGTAVQFYERLIRPLTPVERDELARESRIVGEIFGCPLAAQPRTWAEFEAYWDDTIASLVVSDTARHVAGSLLSGRGLPLRPLWLPSLAVSRAVTAATLSEKVREGYELSWRRRERALASLTLSVTGRVLPRLPDRWRKLGPELLRPPTPEHDAGLVAA